jgi:hypothetical protein
MGSNPINLALRFILELVALFIAGYWAKEQNDAWLGYILMIGIPLIIAILWGVFAVPNDPSRSGSAPIAISGWLRLLLEIAIFSFATFCLHDLGYSKLTWIFGLVVLVHYLISYDRIGWLLKQ